MGKAADSPSFIAATVLLVAWGALAFGSVYPWAYTPLLAGCALTGAVALVVHRSHRLPGATRVAVIALLVVLAAGVAQMVPLPSAAIEAVSPKTDAFLRSHDLSYAFGAVESGRPWHPLSLAPRETLVGVSLLAALTLLLVGLTTALSCRGTRRLTSSIVAFGVLLALIGIVQKAVLGEHAWGGMKIYGFWQPVHLLSTPFGPYVNKNHFAGWMLMGLPLALGLALGLAERALRSGQHDWRSLLLWLSSPKGGRLQLTLLAALVMVASLLMTKSRSGLGGLIVVVLIMSIAAGRRFKSARAGVMAFGSLAAVFAIVFAIAGADLAARITDRSDAMDLRRNIWTDSATIIKDFPLAGTGLNTFGTAMTTYQTTQKDQHFQEAHNDYLQIIVEGGVLVAVPAFIALLLLVRAVYSRFAARQDDSLTHWIRVGASTGLIAVALQSLVEFSLQMPGNAVFAVVLLALALHETPSHRCRGRCDMVDGRWKMVKSQGFGDVAASTTLFHFPFSIFHCLSGIGSWDRLNAHDAQALHDAAVDHGLDALVWAGIAAAGAAPELRALLEPRVRAAAARDLFVQRDLQAVVAGLSAASVPALITKGTALAYTVYAQPWQRPRIDTDLLVRHDDLAAAISALARCGYERSDALSTGELVSHQIAFERIDAHNVHHVLDLHWKIVNPQIVADALSFDELWRTAQAAPALGAAARVPSTAGSMALACVHRLAHHFGQDRSIWLYDLKLLAERLTPEGWSALRQLACDHEIAGFCLDGLRATRERFGIVIPGDVEEAFADAAPHEPSRAYVEGPVSKRDGLFTDLASLPSWRDRARLLREHAFPPAAFMQQRYGTNARWLLPALYVHRIAMGGSKWVRH